MPFLEPGCVLTYGSTRVEVLGTAFLPSGVSALEHLNRVSLTCNERVWYAPWKKRRVTRETFVSSVELSAAWDSGEWKLGVVGTPEDWAELNNPAPAKAAREGEAQ
jgi:hypothetical protein